MEADDVDEGAFFAAIGASGARALLIGRRALVALGAPVLTADYDLWLHFDDIEKLNEALRELELYPHHPPDQARARGRYVLEGGAHVDVLVSRSRMTKDGDSTLTFDDAWQRRRTLRAGPVAIVVPSIDDLILTKRWSMREKDLPDIQLLEALRRQDEP